VIVQYHVLIQSPGIGIPKPKPVPYNYIKQKIYRTVFNCSCTLIL